MCRSTNCVEHQQVQVLMQSIEQSPSTLSSPRREEPPLANERRHCAASRVASAQRQRSANTRSSVSAPMPLSAAPPAAQSLSTHAPPPPRPVHAQSKPPTIRMGAHAQRHTAASADAQPRSRLVSPHCPLSSAVASAAAPASPMRLPAASPAAPHTTSNRSARTRRRRAQCKHGANPQPSACERRPSATQRRAQTHSRDRGSSACTARSRVPSQAPLHLPRRCRCLPHPSRPHTNAQSLSTHAPPPPRPVHAQSKPPTIRPRAQAQRHTGASADAPPRTRLVSPHCPLSSAVASAAPPASPMPLVAASPAAPIPTPNRSARTRRRRLARCTHRANPQPSACERRPSATQRRAQTHSRDRGSSARTARSRVPSQAPLHLPRRCGCLPHPQPPPTPTPNRSARTRRRRAQCKHGANPEPSACERRPSATQAQAQTHGGDRGSSARTARSRVPSQAPLHLPCRCRSLPHPQPPPHQRPIAQHARAAASPSARTEQTPNHPPTSAGPAPHSGERRRTVEIEARQPALPALECRRKRRSTCLADAVGCRNPSRPRTNAQSLSTHAPPPRPVHAQSRPPTIRP
eukprot:SAG11_NODE_3864_length_2182_cov_48.773884_2_plen_576_part_01